MLHHWLNCVQFCAQEKQIIFKLVKRSCSFFPNFKCPSYLIYFLVMNKGEMASPAIPWLRPWQVVLNFTCFVIDIILWQFIFPPTYVKYIALILINNAPSSSGTRHHCNWPTFALLCYRHEPVNVIYFYCWHKILWHVCRINHAYWTRDQWRS